MRLLPRPPRRPRSPSPSATTRCASPAPTRPSRSPWYGCLTTISRSWTPARDRRKSASPWSPPGSATRSWCTRARRSRWWAVIAMAEPGPPGPAGSVESLYPFLYADASDVDAVLAEVRRSTVAKAEEIIALRRTVLDRDRERLLACAADMAGRFAAGGRLFAFGNGGSSSDAQQLVTLF